MFYLCFKELCTTKWKLKGDEVIRVGRKFMQYFKERFLLNAKIMEASQLHVKSETPDLSGLC